MSREPYINRQIVNRQSPMPYPTPPISLSRPRLRASLAALLVAFAVVALPVIFPSLRSVYAPTHDTIVLWLIGNVWYRMYPYSMLILLPLGFLLTGLWGAWIFDTRLLNRLQLRFTKSVIRLSPQGVLYHGLKKVQVYGIYAISTLPARYRNIFPISRIPSLYATHHISAYYRTVANGLVVGWTDVLHLTSEETRVLELRQRMVDTQVGLSRLYVPTLRCIPVINGENIAEAIARLDDAQMYDTHHWPAIRELFRQYARKHRVDADRLTLGQMRTMLEQETELDRTILLRVLINLWFETRDPVIATVIMGYTGGYLHGVSRLFEAVLKTVERESNPVEPVLFTPMPFRRFYPRYLHFIRQARGNAAALYTHELLDDLGRKAEWILARDLPDQTPEDIKQLVRRTAAGFIHLLTSADFQIQSRTWATQGQRLRMHRQAAQDAGWAALYRSGEEHAFARALEGAEQETP